MGFLIFDTDKQSTESLRVQLNALGDRPVRELMDWNAFSSLKAKRIPPPDVIFFDQDGDPERVEGFRHELENYQGTSVVVILGTEPRAKFARKQDSYVRKPIFARKLERSVIESYAVGQQRRSVVGYIGEMIPSGLVREVGRAPKLFRQFLKIDPEKIDAKVLSTLGVIFVMPEGLTEADKELINRLYKITSSSRITIVGVGSTPEETFPLRSRADFFVDRDGDWASILDNIANFRMYRFRSELLLARARTALEEKRVFKGTLILRRLLRHDPWNILAHVLLAENDFAAERFAGAADHYKSILALNPCQPKPHLRLIEIEKRSTGSVQAETSDRARRYCPNLKELQGSS